MLYFKHLSKVSEAPAGGSKTLIFSCLIYSPNISNIPYKYYILHTHILALIIIFIIAFVVI